MSVSLPGHAPSSVPESFSVSDVNPRLFAKIVSEAAEQAFPGERVVLIGWSTGGFAALATAIEFPHLVKSVVSINGFSRGRWGDLLGMMQRLAVSGWGQGLFRLSLNSMFRQRGLFRWVMRRLRAQNDRADEFTEQVLYQMFAAGRHNDAHTMLQLFAGLSSVDLSHRLSSIQCPVCVLSGAQDTVISPAEGRFLKEHIPGSELIELASSGHLFFADAWKPVMDCMIQAMG